MCIVFTTSSNPTRMVRNWQVCCGTDNNKQNPTMTPAFCSLPSQKSLQLEAREQASRKGTLYLDNQGANPPDGPQDPRLEVRCILGVSFLSSDSPPKATGLQLPGAPKSCCEARWEYWFYPVEGSRWAACVTRAQGRFLENLNIQNSYKRLNRGLVLSIQRKQVFRNIVATVQAPADVTPRAEGWGLSVTPACDPSASL